MNKRDHIKEFAQYEEKIRELELQGREQGNTSMYYSTEDIKKLTELGKIPKYLSDWYLAWIDKQNDTFNQWQKFINANPHMTEDDRLTQFHGLPRKLSIEESLEHYKSIVNIGLIHNIITGIKRENLIGNTNTIEPSKTKLFKNVNHEINFGIAGIMADTMYRLIDLLELKLEYTYGDHYEAKGTIKNSYGNDIELAYSFQANSEDEAKVRLEDYKHMMRTKGIKILMAFWKAANTQGYPEYTIQLIDIMKFMSDEKREAHFSTKEKQEFWNITQILNKTIVRLHRPVKKKRTRFIQQPLVEILGGETKLSDENKYPLTVSVRVLSQQVNKNEFAPILYHNNTVQTNPNDTFIAFMFQTRAARKKDGNEWDWESLYNIGNLKNTAKSNPSVAKVTIRKKVKKLNEEGIISEYAETTKGIYIKPSTQDEKK